MRSKLIRAIALILVLSTALLSCSNKKATREEKIARFAEENSTFEKGQIVFIGDSITEKYDLRRHHKNAELKLYNRGISGDTTDWLIERLDISLFALAPRSIVLMIGTNDINYGKSAEEIALNYATILSLIALKLPDAEVTCVSIIPQNEKYSASAFDNNERIKATNEKIKALAELYGYKYVNLYDVLTDKDGFLKRGYSTDGLHLSRRGYKVYTETIKNKL